MEPIRYVAGGKLGDFNQSLSVVCEMFHKTGRKGIVYLSEGMEGDKFQFGIKKTLEDTRELVGSQPYIQEYTIHSGQPFDINLNIWRKSPLLYTTNWYDIYSSVYNIEWGAHPWITVPKRPEYLQVVLVSCSTNLYIKNVDWEKLFTTYGPTVFFISQNVEEYASFHMKHRFRLPFIKVESLYELVRAIASCKLFIGALSSPLTYAYATHTRCIPGLEGLTGDPVHNIGLDTHLKHVMYEIPPA